MAELPAFAIIYGPRAFFAFAGISTILAGMWRAENIFDELGVKAFENANAAGLEPVAYFNEVSKINKDELDAACPIPWLTVTGWAILAFANLIPHQLSLGGFSLDVALPGMIGTVCCITLGFLAAFPIRESYNNRDLKAMVHSYQFTAAFAAIFVGSIIADNLKGAFWLCPIGAVLIALSLHVLWKHRKMGESWMRNGQPNWNYVVCNGGGNLFVVGWIIFFVGFTAIPGNVVAAIDVPQIPIYMTLRSFLAYFSIFVIVLMTILVEYATDEHDDLQQGLGAIGTFTGRFSELFISLSFMSSFALYGIASFFPSETSVRIVVDIILVLSMIMQGRAYGLSLQKAVPNKDNERRSRLGRIIMVIFGFVVIFQAFTGWTSCVSAILGVALVAAGDSRMMNDRKRGRLWMETENVNPAPYVFSYGPIFYTSGWVLLALAMSIPQFVW